MHGSLNRKIYHIIYMFLDNLRERFFRSSVAKVFFFATSVHEC